MLPAAESSLRMAQILVELQTTLAGSVRLQVLLAKMVEGLCGVLPYWPTFYGFGMTLTAISSFSIFAPFFAIQAATSARDFPP